MKIMLDAGHGFNTEGKRSPDGLKEYEFNRKVAADAKELLQAYQNVTVYFAHSDARDVPLQERTDTANRLKVDAYVAIHANANGSTWNDAGGIETYVYPTKPAEAYQLAEKIQKHLVALTGLKNRGVKTADFHVLRETHMTAVLAECGFMTNRNEAQLMHTDAFQKKCAEAITLAIAEQYHLVSKSKSPSHPDPTPTPPPTSAHGLYKVQAGAFVNQKNADALVQRLNAAGFTASSHFEPATSTTKELHKVQAGAFADKKNAESLLQSLKAAGFEAFIFLES